MESSRSRRDMECKGCRTGSGMGSKGSLGLMGSKRAILGSQRGTDRWKDSDSGEESNSDLKDRDWVTSSLHLTLLQDCYQEY